MKFFEFITGFYKPLKNLSVMRILFDRTFSKNALESSQKFDFFVEATSAALERIDRESTKASTNIALLEAETKRLVAKLATTELPTEMPTRVRIPLRLTDSEGLDTAFNWDPAIALERYVLPADLRKIAIDRCDGRCPAAWFVGTIVPCLIKQISVGSCISIRVIDAVRVIRNARTDDDAYKAIDSIFGADPTLAVLWTPHMIFAALGNAGLVDIECKSDKENEIEIVTISGTKRVSA